MCSQAVASTPTQQRINVLLAARDVAFVQQLRVLTLTCTGTLDRACPGKPARYAASPPYALTGQRGTGRHTWPGFVVTFDSMASWSTMWHLQAEQEYTRGPFSHCLNGLPMVSSAVRAALSGRSCPVHCCPNSMQGRRSWPAGGGPQCRRLCSGAARMKVQAKPEHRHLASTRGGPCGPWVVVC